MTSLDRRQFLAEVAAGVAAAQAAGKQVQIAHLPVGHNQMTEAPEQTLSALRSFLEK